ncbi:hypothetical protein G4O51_11515 [Candidatus Bathyarchaeota archaeon A05DMB-2]|jgi:hypothetical protein|nr:hypothetical protein [Candidatus Bathyarchaeota archaeon A05DMB-2]
MPDISHETLQNIYNKLRSGCTRASAAGSAGVSLSDFEELIRQNETVAFEVERAEAEAAARVEQALHAAALKGNASAAQLWLATRRPEDWGNAQNTSVTTIQLTWDSLNQGGYGRVAEK